MGTYYTPANGRTYRQFVAEELKGSRNVIDFSVVGNVAYILCGPEGGKGIEVWKLSRYDGDIGYKPMAEEELPYYFDCPARLLDRCDATTNRNATAWREQCRTNHAARARVRRLKDGQHIELEEALNYGRYGYASRFIVKYLDQWRRGRVARVLAFLIYAPGQPNHLLPVRITRLSSRRFTVHGFSAPEEAAAN
jgi:hypothetical protein